MPTATIAQELDARASVALEKYIAALLRDDNNADKLLALGAAAGRSVSEIADDARAAAEAAAARKLANELPDPAIAANDARDERAKLTADLARATDAATKAATERDCAVARLMRANQLATARHTESRERRAKADKLERALRERVFPTRIAPQPAAGRVAIDDGDD
jgi:hypothetical protein